MCLRFALRAPRAPAAHAPARRMEPAHARCAFPRRRCVMSRTATAASPARDDEATMTRVDTLVQRGRGRGQLSLPELRAAFEEAGISAVEGRSILRELADSGVLLGNEPAEAAGPADRAAAAAGPAADADTEAEVEAEATVTAEAEAAAAAIAAMES